MFVLRRTNIGELRHVRTVCQPSLVQGFAYILLLVCLACIITWLSSYRDRLQCHAAAAEKPQHSSDKCPFTIRQLNKSTYLIRENDRFVSLVNVPVAIGTWNLTVSGRVPPHIREEIHGAPFKRTDSNHFHSE